MKRVLVADDEPVTLRLHQMVLRQAGVEAALFEDGDSVILEMDSVSPDLAVLDYQLPGKNGLELVAALRAHPKFAGIPIIVVTGYRELELKEALLEAGANEVIGVMHTNVSITGAALDIVGERYGGPLMAYPDSGYFEMPNWKFADVIAPAALAEEARGWIAQGAQIIGGCCGTGVEHIVALREMLDRRAAGG